MLHVLSTPFLTLNREEWVSLQNDIPLTLSKREIINLKKINNNLSINEVIEIYLPLSKFLNSHIYSNIKQKNFLEKFLSTRDHSIPYVIGITGSVAVGKSTTAKILQALLSKWPKSRTVELVTTDRFLHSNTILKKRNLMEKKGFPQSYDDTNLKNFILKIKSGIRSISIPIYSHNRYDIVPNIQQIIYNPDILILEGLNILQNNHNSSGILISDFIDFSIYIDAPEHLLQKWYINRFLKFCNTNFSPSYFCRFSKLSEKEIISVASYLWTKINKLNLQKNILPTKKNANLILKKGINHIIDNIQLRNNNYNNNNRIVLFL